MSMLVFAVRDVHVNRDRLMKVCMVHDLAESVVGDITPYDGVSKEQKRILEEVDMLYLLTMTQAIIHSNLCLLIHIV